MGEISRRAFIQMAVGTGTAIAAATGGKFTNKLIPYVIPPEETRPGEWIFFATTCRECPAGCGMHLWHSDGRVTKAEGNPTSPINEGGLCPRGQASLQGLYDPDRVQRPFRMKNGQRHEMSWDDIIAAIGDELQQPNARVALLSNLQTGALADVSREFVQAFNSQNLLFYEPFNYEPLRVAHEKVFGRGMIPEYRLDNCDFIISFGADFLETWISPVQFAKQFAAMHSLHDGRVGRFVYVGPRLSMTATNADNYVPVPPGDDLAVAARMLEIIIDRGWAKSGEAQARQALDSLPAESKKLPAGVQEKQIEDFAKEFAQSQRSVALAGPVGCNGRAAVNTAIIASLLNQVTGRVGQSVDFSRVHALSNTAASEQVQAFFRNLTENDVVVINQSNPAYSLPWTTEHLQQAGTIIYLGTLLDETAKMADYYLPVNSHLESWNEYEAYTGYHQLMQPTMATVYATRDSGDVLLAMAQAAGKPLKFGQANQSPLSFERLLHSRWQQLHAQTKQEKPFDEFWQESLQSGGYWEQAPPAKVQLQQQVTCLPAQPEKAAADQPKLWLWPPIMLFDGSLSNRGWLQESPEPVSYASWSSWIDVHPTLATALGLRNDDMLEISNHWGKATAPVRITEEVDEGTVALAFGQGHTAMGQNAAGLGTNAFNLAAPSMTGGSFGTVTVRQTGEKGNVVYTSPTKHQFNRDIVQWEALSKVRTMKMSEADEIIMPLPEGYNKERDLYPPHDYKHHRWAMVIDLQRCIGCGACGVACYAENNIPVFGREQVAKGREMAWLKIVPYKEDENPHRVGWLPLLCQHCDAAPCEPVCPVFAAVHNNQGLNAQIYNRCVGTRYCSNNCPYKVRRFEWFDPVFRKPLNLQLNPSVTVRSRGVMEKCTFCIQRILRVEHQAKYEGRPVRDGEIQPACVQSCPTHTYVFGDLMDPNSEVSKIIKNDPRRYQLLRELNTKPANFFLKRIKLD